MTLTVGARTKEGKGGGGTWRFREQIVRSKKKPALQARLSDYRAMEQ